MKLTTSNVVTGNISVSRLTIGNTAVVESLNLGNVNFTPSAVTVGNVSITPAAITTPQLIVGGVSYTGGTWGGIVNYQEFTVSGTWNNPYANASANASLTGNEQVLVMAWGGGGGSTSNNNFSQGGGGGACVIGNYILSSLANTVTVTVGTGGAGSRTTTTAITAAANGTNSSFDSLTAPGGGGATATGPNGGGGGGLFGVGDTSGNGGAPLGGAIGNPGGVSTFGGGGGGNAGGANGGSSVFGGGGGTRGQALTGGLSIYGGGGGASNGSGAGSSGTSVFGGNGGNNTVGAGGIPGGGAGANNSSVSTGGRGEVRVWVFGTAGTTLGSPTYTLTANTTTLNEGSSVLYTVSTTNVSNGTTLYYTLNSTSSSATTSDFSSAVNGAVVISGGTGTFTLTANSDTDSANEAFQMDLRTISTTGTIVASNGSVSITPAPVTVLYRSTIQPPYTEAVANTTVFSAVPIGTATSTRRVLILVFMHKGNGGATLNSATIGGISANIDIQANGGGAGDDCVAAIVSATVPTGTTADVSLTFSLSPADVEIFAYALDNLINTTPVDTAFAIAAGTATNSLTTGASVDYKKDGYVISICHARVAGTNTWTGISDERYDGQVGGTASIGSIADQSPTSDSNNNTITSTLSGTAASRYALVVASYR